MLLPLNSHIDPDTLDKFRDSFSKKLFGNRYRLEICAAVARASQPFYLHEIALAVAVDDASVRNVMNDLAASGMIRRIEGKRGAAKFFERRESPIWELLEQALTDGLAAVADNAA